MIDEISSGMIVVTLEVEVADCEVYVWAVVIASVVVNGSGNNYMVHTMI
jgi:hypothetical protein